MITLTFPDGAQRAGRSRGFRPRCGGIHFQVTREEGRGRHRERHAGRSRRPDPDRFDAARSSRATIRRRSS